MHVKSKKENAKIVSGRGAATKRGVSISVIDMSALKIVALSAMVFSVAFLRAILAANTAFRPQNSYANKRLWLFLKKGIR